MRGSDARSGAPFSYVDLEARVAPTRISTILYAMQLGVLLDLLAIPWLFVVRTYLIAIFQPGA